MDVSQHKVDGLVHQVTLVIPTEDVENTYQQELLSIGKEVKISGFRAGHVPAKILEQRYGDSAYDEAVRRVVGQSLEKFYKDKDIKAANVAPTTTFQERNRGKDIKVEVKFEALPAIEIKDVKKLKLKKLAVQPSEKELNEALESLRSMQRSSKAEAVERPAQDGDVVNMSFELYLEGEDKPLQKRPEGMVILGEDTPFFEETKKLIGMSAGEEKVLHTRFPEDESYGSYAGKKVKFHIKVRDVRVRPEVSLDDKFAITFGAENMADLKEKYTAMMIGRADGEVWTQQKRLVLDALAEQYNFAVPPTLVEREFNNIWNRFLHDYHNHQHHDHDEHGKCQLGLDAAEEKKIKATYEKIAERRVRLGLLLAEMSKQHKPQTSRQEFAEYLRYSVSRMGEEIRREVQKELKAPHKETPLLSYFQSQYFEDSMIRLLLTLAGVEEEKLSLAELNKRAEAAGDVFA